MIWVWFFQKDDKSKMTPSLGEKCLKKSNLTDLTNGFSSLNEKLCCSGFYHKKNQFYKKAGFCFQLFSQWMEEPKGIPSNWFCNVRNPQGGVRGLVVWSPNSYSHPVGHTIQCWNEQLNWWCSRLLFKGTSKRENKE